MRRSVRSMFAAAVLLALISSRSAAVGTSDHAPVDPFDYAYCGGKPVYPVIGFNFSTACGPRNQIGLGRRGRLMWLFTTVDGQVHASGNRALTEAELGKLVLLAEAAQLAGAPAPAEGPVRYDLGINFTGRREKRAHGVLFAAKDSVQALFDALKRQVPAEPLLPECADAPADFSPTRLPHQWRAVRANEQ